ncbi:amidohydrolase family protein [Gordonia sp. SID5947]|uniref:amidohydrolase family protein n=1 Tax=Gordonia sp. SID5947 TaxID=2690315 RepID=UPI001368254C|nr:amidohydrolase family protein [Gordonia sp. SID5947]MYR07958.1 amidohydrolase family protein [Gordonia sp. SID5947]
MIVDWHTHVWLPEHLGDWGDYLHGAPEEGSHEQHAKAMAEAGVEGFIAIALTSRFLNMSVPNDYVAEYVNNSGGLGVGVASVDPNDPGALEELERAATELKLRGLKLSPPYQNFHPQSDEAFAIYELADRFGMFLIFHQGTVFHPRCSLAAANPILLDPVAGAFPQMPMIIAHLGQPWIGETTAVMARHKNVFTDVSARLTRPWQLYNGLMGALDYNTIDRVLFGTDFPLVTPQRGAELLRGLNTRLQGVTPIPDDVIEGLLHNRPLSLITRTGAVEPASRRS